MNAILIADLGYGDAGKGSLVDALARETGARCVVRYNGGAQAAHNVITPDSRHHTFSQFGSAAFVPGARTHLSRFMILHPLSMLAEERALRGLGVSGAFERVSIERDALVISPYQQAANRLRELARGPARHGSCGLGVGETMSDWLTHGDDILRAGDLDQPGLVRRKLERIREIKRAQLAHLLPALRDDPQAAAELSLLDDPNLSAASAEVYAYFAGLVQRVDASELGRLLRQPGGVIFEGAQGVLLDEWWGFYPYNTWTTLTYRNAETLLAENGFDGPVLRLGLTRAYATRHGAGPFVSEDPSLTAALPDAHNVHNPWQRGFRAGHLDLLALRYALSVTGQVDALALTCLDRRESQPDPRVCVGYLYPGDPADLDGFFSHAGQSVSAITPPANPTDLAQQERLTHLLMQMRPELEDWPAGRAEFAARLEQALGLPIAVSSSGPTALDKTIRLPITAAL